MRFGTDPVTAELKQRLTSLDANCLTNLQAGLEGMSHGDLTLAVTPVTTPIATRAASKDMQELVDLFNSMLGKAQGALEGYNAVRSEYQQALGDDSCLAELQVRLASLSGHCLTNLGPA